MHRGKGKPWTNKEEEEGTGIKEQREKEQAARESRKKLEELSKTVRMEWRGEERRREEKRREERNA